MGMFSWIDVDGLQNITDEDNVVAMLIPEQHKEAVGKIFGVEMGSNGVEGKYNGYGSIITEEGTEVDIYDVTPFLNICCTTDRQYEDMLQYKTTDGNARTRLDNTSKACADEIRQAYKDGKIETIADIVNIITNYDDEFRSLGIDLACYDNDNARLPYPIKVTTDPSRSYENSNFSMGDPNQGFFKVNTNEKGKYEYNEYDWGYGEPTIEEEEWNEETGEYETVEVDNPEYIDPYDDWCQSEECSKYEACEEIEKLDDERFRILEQVRKEQEAKGIEATPEAPKEEAEEYKPDYTLVGVDGNAFSVMGYTARALKNEGLRDKVDEMHAKATEGDYSHLLCVCMEYIDMANEAKNAPKTFGKSDVDMPTENNKNKGQIQE